MWTTNLTICKQILSLLSVHVSIRNRAQQPTQSVLQQSLISQLRLQTPTQWRICRISDCTDKHCHCPNSWKRRDWAGKEEEPVLKARQYGRAEKQGCLQNKPPDTGKSFGRNQSKLSCCYQHALSLLPLLFNCLRSFMLWWKPSYREQLQL